MYAIRSYYEKTEQNNALELAQREIKLKMMASQINPHFLFNALESIRMNAHMKGDKEIANVVRLLGKLMRKNLEVGREQTPLKEEIEMVRSYLEIQKFRYEDRLSFEVKVDPAASNMMIPPLVIQPLVENVITSYSIHYTKLYDYTHSLIAQLNSKLDVNALYLAFDTVNDRVLNERLNH